MGNNTSGNVRVQTSKPSYIAGEEVQGNVYVHLTAPTKCRGVFLALRGKESVLFNENKTREVQSRDSHEPTRTETYHLEHRDENVFMNVVLPLMPATKGVLQPGQYQIPFSVSLPPTAPGTFQRESGSSPEVYQCWIGYEVEAYVEVPGIFTSNIKHQQPIVVTARPPDPSQAMAETVERTGTVCFMCCIPRGEVWMRAHMSRNYYVPGETAYVMLEVNNGSSTRVSSLTVRLMRTLQLKTRSGRASFFKSDVFSASDYPGLAPRESCMNDRCRSVPISLVHSSNHSNNNSSSSGPVMLQPEVTCSLMQCRYEIEVLAQLDWSPSIAVTIPIHLLALPISPPTPAPVDYNYYAQQYYQQQQQQVTLPQAQEVAVWDPIMMEPVKQEATVLSVVGVVDPSAPPQGDAPPAYSLTDATAPPPPYEYSNSGKMM